MRILLQCTIPYARLGVDGGQVPALSANDLAGVNAFQRAGDPRALEDIHAYVANSARWLAPLRPS